MDNINFRGKDINGHMEGDVYVTSRLPKHVMQMHQAFGVSVSILDLVYSLGAKRIRFVYTNGNFKKIFEFDIMSYITSTKTWTDYTTDGKPDLQKFVKMEAQDWDEIKAGLPKLKSKKKKEDAPNPV